MRHSWAFHSLCNWMSSVTYASSCQPTTATRALFSECNARLGCPLRSRRFLNHRRAAHYRRHPHHRAAAAGCGALNPRRGAFRPRLSARGDARRTGGGPQTAAQGRGGYHSCWPTLQRATESGRFRKPPARRSARTAPHRRPLSSVIGWRRRHTWRLSCGAPAP